jgi:type I restriction enzyme S subunit
MKTGWETKKIGDICHLMTGGTPSRSNPEYFGGETRWLVSGDIHQGQIFDCEGRITEAGMKDSNAKLLPVNSVMIALNGQGKTRGTVALLRTEATCNQSLVSIYPNDPKKLLPEFLYVNLHGRYQEIRQMTGDSGNDRRGLNMILIRNIEIPVPPLPEQKRIVAILDEAFDAIATAKANAEKNLQNARALFDSHLNAVFSQRGEYTSKRIGDIAEVYDGPHATPKTVESGPVFLGISALQDGKINLGETRHVTPEDFQRWTRRVKPAPDDVVFSYETRLGQAAIIPRGLECCLGRRMGLVRLDLNQVDPSFFVYQYVSPPFREFLNSKTIQGATVDRISIRDFPSFEVLLPPLNKQRELSGTIRRLNEYSEDLKSVYQRKLAALDDLKKSLLHQAFSGQLTRDN